MTEIYQFSHINPSSQVILWQGTSSNAANVLSGGRVATSPSSSASSPAPPPPPPPTSSKTYGKLQKTQPGPTRHCDRTPAPTPRRAKTTDRQSNRGPRIPISKRLDCHHPGQTWPLCGWRGTHLCFAYDIGSVADSVSCGLAAVGVFWSSTGGVLGGGWDGCGCSRDGDL